MQKMRDRFLWRATFLGPSPDTLEDVLRALHRQFRTRDERTIQQSNSSCLDCSEYSDDRGEGVFLHVLAYTPDEETSVVINQGRPNSVLSTTKAPKGSEFWDDDIIVMCRGDDLVMCANSTHGRTFDRYVVGLLQRAKRDDAASLFQVIPVANVSKVRMLQENGVRSIRLRSGLHSTTLDRVAETSIRGKIFGPISREMKKYIRKNREFEELLAAENPTVEVSLRFDSRRRGGDVAQEAFRRFGEDVLETDSGDQFEIETLDGQRLKSDDLQLRKRVQLPAHGKTVVSLEARRELEIYFQELRQQGALEGAP
jgi:hypothetical protein